MNEHMYLFIDTSEQKWHRIGLVNRGGDSEHAVIQAPIPHWRDGAGCSPKQGVSEAPRLEQRCLILEGDLESSLLPSMDEFFLKLGKTVQNVSGIIVITGPGGFTSLRLGISTANALGWALRIPVVGVEKNAHMNQEELVALGLKRLRTTNKCMPVFPFYGREPNITKRRA